MPTYPHIKPHREYESPIHEYRLVAGLTHKELAAQANVDCTSICGLANGTLSPIMENGSGQLKPAAKKLCEFFGVGPDDLFPRYVCTLDRTYKFEIQPYETWSERAAENCWAKFENHDLASYLIKVGLADATARELRIFKGHIFDSLPFTEIARKEGITGTRVAGIFAKTLSKIRAVAKKIGLPVANHKKQKKTPRSMV